MSKTVVIFIYYHLSHVNLALAEHEVNLACFDTVFFLSLAL